MFMKGVNGRIEYKGVNFIHLRLFLHLQDNKDLYVSVKEVE